MCAPKALFPWTEIELKAGILFSLGGVKTASANLLWPELEYCTGLRFQIFAYNQKKENLIKFASCKPYLYLNPSAYR